MYGEESVPIILNMMKVDHEDHIFNTMEARAITCFNMGNLIFKILTPKFIRTQDNMLGTGGACFKYVMGGTVTSIGGTNVKCTLN